MFDFDAFWHASSLGSAGDERAVFGDGTPAFVRQRGCSNYLPLFWFFFPFSAVLQPDAALLG